MMVSDFLKYSFDDLFDLFVVKTENAKETANVMFNMLYKPSDQVQKGDVVFDCKSEELKIDYSSYLFNYKKRNVSEYANEKAFRILLNEYILNFKLKTIIEKKNVFLQLTSEGKFIAIKKTDEEKIVCDLSETERTLFNFLCFIEVNKFWQYVNDVRDFNCLKKPLIVINFSEYLDESFGYTDFLKKQNLNCKIILIEEYNVPKTSHCV